MRLDHLLSREHFILPVAGAVVVFVVLCFLVFRVARGEWSVPGPCFVGLGALSGFGLAGLAGYLGAGFGLCLGFLVGWLFFV